MKKVFISGPMTGYPNNNKEEFFRAEAFLSYCGFSVFNPAWLCFNPAWSHDEIMAVDLAALSKCDYIYQLSGWQTSNGAYEEYQYATNHDIDILTTKDIVCNCRN